MGDSRRLGRDSDAAGLAGAVLGPARDRHDANRLHALTLGSVHQQLPEPCRPRPAPGRRPRLVRGCRDATTAPPDLSGRGSSGRDEGLCSWALREPAATSPAKHTASPSHRPCAANTLLKALLRAASRAEPFCWIHRVGTDSAALRRPSRPPARRRRGLLRVPVPLLCSGGNEETAPSGALHPQRAPSSVGVGGEGPEGGGTPPARQPTSVAFTSALQAAAAAAVAGDTAARLRPVRQARGRAAARKGRRRRQR